MKLEYENGVVKTINVKTKDDNGYLVDTPLKIADAYIVSKSKDDAEPIRTPVKLEESTIVPGDIRKYNYTGDVTGTDQNLKGTSKLLYNDSIYDNPNRSEKQDGGTAGPVKGYQAVYIRPDEDKTKPETNDGFTVAEGDDIDIIIKFTVDKKDRTSEKPLDRNIKLGLKSAIAEIGAYSTYYKTGDNSYKPAGLVDKDSNAGNFGEEINGAKMEKGKTDYIRYFEDDTFETDIKLGLEDGNERTTEGFVWDDARTDVAKALEYEYEIDKSTTKKEKDGVQLGEMKSD